MNESFESDEYLDKIGLKATLHNETLKSTKKYLIEKQITDYQKIENCLIISQVWAADRYDSSLTYSDLLLYLGNETPPTMFYEELFLEKYLKNKTLEQVLDITIKSSGDVLK